MDTCGYEKKVQEEQTPQQVEKQVPPKQENMEQQREQQENPQQTQGNGATSPSTRAKSTGRNWSTRWGVKRDDLEKSGNPTKMLNYGKSDLVKVKPTFGGESFELTPASLLQEGRRGKHQPRAALHPQGAEVR